MSNLNNGLAIVHFHNITTYKRYDLIQKNLQSSKQLESLYNNRNGTIEIPFCAGSKMFIHV